MQFSTVLPDVIAGTLSGALVAAIPLRRSVAPLIQGSVVATDGGVARIDVDASRHTSVSYVTQTIQRAHHPARSRPEPWTQEDQMMATLVGSIAAVIGFLFAWPVAIGVTAGVSCVACAAQALAAIRLRGSGRGLSCSELLQAAVTGLATIAACWFVLGSAAGEWSIRHVDRQLGQLVPGYDGDSGERWSGLWHHIDTVFAFLGVEGFASLLLQLVGLVFLACVTLRTFARAVGLDALLRAEEGRQLGRLRLKFAEAARSSRGWNEFAVTLLGCAIALFLTSGLAFDLFQHHVVDAATTAVAV